MKKLISIVIITLGLMVVVLSTGFAEVYSLRVSPGMELLAGVLSHTTWIERLGPDGEGNEYFRALNEFFLPYQDHEAVKIAQDLTDGGFVYDAPPAFIAHLGSLPELELAYEYSDYLVRRAGKRERLEKFRLALKELAKEANFLDFYAHWEPYLHELVTTSNVGFRPDVITDWLEEFFGWPAAEFHIILTPAMFPGGGYGATVTNLKGESIAYQITREYGRSTTKPEFPTGQNLEALTIHELGHSFVNPSLEAYPTEVKALRPLYNRVRQEMKDQAYPNVQIFFNEQVLRAVEVIAAYDLYDEQTVENTITYNEERGFYLMEFVVEQLKVYRANRAQYPTFRDFVPYLLDQLADYQKEHCSFWEMLIGIWPF